MRRLVGPGGAVVGIDTSSSMLDAARRRVRRAGWPDVVFVEADATDVAGALRTVGVDVGAVRAVVATFVLSLLPDDAPVWQAVDALASRQPLCVAVADLGPPVDAPAPLRPLLRALTALGGGDPARRPWEQLLARSADAAHEVCHGGHVHLAVGDMDHPG
ncbi:MAG: methyltransferase domain-containing protein [Acidimicrobiia bacterium]|nr:methyltransferase domain-containing protein [Acidimicrobiia bacterium]